MTRFAMLFVSLLLSTTMATAGTRPNFLFLVSEDNSIHYLRLYGARHGATPHISSLARNGLVFDHAFSCSPVCSVARSTLATAIYAPRGGFQYHRKIRKAPLPPGLLPWSAVLKQNGYYTTNRRKTDYNFQFPIKRLWHASSAKASWRNRPDKQTPFFHMQSFGQSHESSLHFPRAQFDTPTTVSPDAVTLAPYHPDTATFRYTHARYFDRMGVIDQQIGRVLRQLTTDGLLEDTFVFYFGDHGGVLPRSKGYAYESGLHVPLVVRVPANFRHLVDHKPNTRLGGFVSFIDFGPTVLHLAGRSSARTFRPKTWLHATRHSVTRTVSTKNTITCELFARAATPTSATTRASTPTDCRTTTVTACSPSRSGGNCTGPKNSTLSSSSSSARRATLRHRQRPSPGPQPVS